MIPKIFISLLPNSVRNAKKSKSNFDPTEA